MKPSESQYPRTGRATAGPTRGVPNPALKRAVTASAIGNATEWFDYGLYAYGISYISAALFPGSIEQATFFALATFAISFLIRPLGGFFWGPLGDRLGRKTILAMTILLMAGATFGIGLIPTYDIIGLWAPAALIALRMLQGFSAGGEYGGAATFMAEYSPDDKRGFYGSFLEFGTLAGFSAGALLMLGFSLLLGDDVMHDWGWRLPFLIAAPLGLVGMHLRSRIKDTPVFLEMEENAPAPLTAGEAPSTSPPAAEYGEGETKTSFRQLVVQYWQPLIVLGGLVVALNVVNYTLLSYMPTYFRSELGLTTDQSLLVPIIGMLFMMVFLPLAGTLSDRVGRKPMWWISLIGLFVLVVPMYTLMSTGLAGAIVGFVVLGLLYVPQLATISATFPAMFPTHVRFAGFAISYNISTSLFGGTAPALNDWLTHITGNQLMPAYFMMAACAVGAIAMLFMVETAGKSLRGTEIPGTVESELEVAALDRAS